MRLFHTVQMIKNTQIDAKCNTALLIYNAYNTSECVNMHQICIKYEMHERHTDSCAIINVYTNILLAMRYGFKIITQLIVEHEK